jgi:hypothetical protein
MRKFISKALFILCMISALRADVHFIDLNGTVLDVDKKQSLLTIGTRNIAQELLFFYNPFQKLMGYSIPHDGNFRQHLVDIFFRGLSAIDYKLPIECQVDYEMYSDDNVTVLPPILRDTMLGHFTYSTTRKLCNTMLKEKGDKIFTENQKRIFLNMLEIAFNPETFIRVQKEAPLLKTVAKYATEVDKDGNKKNVCIILSNWAKDGVPLLKEYFASELMQYIDDAVFSCDGFGGKPGRAIYEHCYDLVKEKYPEQLNKPWFFFDDQKVNGDGFEKFVHENPDLGIKFYYAHPHDATHVLKQFATK